VPPAAPVGSTTVAHEYAAQPFVCPWEIGSWGAAWVRVAGELDLGTSPEFCRTLEEAQRAARVVVLDLRGLCFIDSSGVHVILDAAHDTRRYGGRLLIVRGPASVDRVLTLTGVGKHALIFDLAPTAPGPALVHALPPEVAV
jgi:anti-sigma B factor antagonist